MSDVFVSREQAESDLLAAAAFIGERIRSTDGHAEAMAVVVPEYLRRGDVDLAAELSNAVDDPFSRDRLLIGVAEKCAQLGDDEYAVQLAEAIEDHGLQSQAYERVGTAMAAEGRVDKAMQVAELTAHPDLIYAAIALYQANAANVQKADETLQMIDFPTARVSALQQIAAVQIGAANNDGALEHLDRAVEESSEIEHEEERIRALTDIGALQLEAKRNDKAIVTFAEARALAENLDNQHRDHFLGSCALGFLHAGSTDLADATLDQVTDKTQMASALLAFSREYWRRGEQDEALDTLDEAQVILGSQKEKEIRDSRSRNALLTSIAVQFAGFAKNDRAVESALEIVDPTERASALTQISKVFSMRKEAELARQTIELIDEDANRLEAYVAIADAEDELGERESARALLDEAVQLAETVPQLAVRSTVMNEIAARLAAHGDTETARAIANQNLSVILQIRDDSSRAAALSGLASVYEEAGLELGESEIQVLRRLTVES